MEASGGSSPGSGSGSGGGGSSRRFPLQLAPSNYIHGPLSALLDYSGILRPRQSHPEHEGLVSRGVISGSDDPPSPAAAGGEVSIRIIGDNLRGSGQLESTGSNGGADEVLDRRGGEDGREGVAGELSLSASSASQSSAAATDGQSTDGDSSAAGGNGRDSSYQRYEIQQVARWIEQVLPFSLLLLVVFIRQHLQGFFITIWISALMFKSNEILRKQTALKGERRISVLIGITLVFILHVIGVYWWYKSSDLLYPLVMCPPTEIPPFWHAIFIIMVNDTIVRLAAMAFKCVLLIYYKNSRGHNYRKQGQMLTLLEYLLLLYRAFLPTPVWYRFFSEQGIWKPLLITNYRAIPNL